MTIEWTPSMLAKREPHEIRNISENCQDVGRNDIVELCEAELAKRKIKPVKAYRTKQSLSNSSLTKRNENQAIYSLIELANELIKVYDLSSSRARILSAATKNFRPHEFLSSKGNPKIGKSRRLSLVAFERHLSYKLHDEVYELMVVQVNVSDSVRYQVMAPERFLSNPISLYELRPYLEKLNEKTFLRYGESFLKFSDAADKFRQILEDVAPKSIDI